MKYRVPSGREEIKPMEIPPATVEVGRSVRKLGEGDTIRKSHFTFRIAQYDPFHNVRNYLKS
ncbi:MAG: hypothetical protein ACYCT2_01500 [Thermoplasmataceae archaeon]